jgi:hypothetical protein
MTLITGIIGIMMLAAFLGIMLIWVPAPPLIVIIGAVTLMLIYDFVMTLRYGEDYADRRIEREPSRATASSTARK